MIKKKKNEPFSLWRFGAFVRSTKALEPVAELHETTDRKTRSQRSLSRARRNTRRTAWTTDAHCRAVARRDGDARAERLRAQLLTVLAPPPPPPSLASQPAAYSIPPRSLFTSATRPSRARCLAALYFFIRPSESFELFCFLFFFSIPRIIEFGR